MLQSHYGRMLVSRVLDFLFGRPPNEDHPRCRRFAGARGLLSHSILPPRLVFGRRSHGLSMSKSLPSSFQSVFLTRSQSGRTRRGHQDEWHGWVSALVSSWCCWLRPKPLAALASASAGATMEHSSSVAAGLDEALRQIAHYLGDEPTLLPPIDCSAEPTRRAACSVSGRPRGAAPGA